MSKEEQLKIIKDEYESTLNDVISYGNKSGWKLVEILESPYLLLHLIIEYHNML